MHLWGRGGGGQTGRHGLPPGHWVWSRARPHLLPGRVQPSITCVKACAQQRLGSRRLHARVLTLSRRPSNSPTQPLQHLATPLFPAVTLKNAELAANFGAEAWKFPPPPGYQGFLPGGSIGEGLVSWEVASAPAQAGSNAARRPLALILEPTRELAEQTHDNLGLFSKFLPVPGVRTALCLGGTNPKAAERALAEGADIVTGTPGESC